MRRARYMHWTAAALMFAAAGCEGGFGPEGVVVAEEVNVADIAIERAYVISGCPSNGCPIYSSPGHGNGVMSATITLHGDRTLTWTGVIRNYVDPCHGDPLHPCPTTITFTDVSSIGVYQWAADGIHIHLANPPLGLTADFVGRAAISARVPKNWGGPESFVVTSNYILQTWDWKFVPTAGP